MTRTASAAEHWTRSTTAHACNAKSEHESTCAARAIRPDLNTSTKWAANTTPRSITCARSSFRFSRYNGNKHQHRIDFPLPTTEKLAIEAAQAFLSQPLTQEWWDTIRLDTFHEYTWEQAQAHDFKIRGHALTDCIFLESTELDDKGLLTFWVGS